MAERPRLDIRRGAAFVRHFYARQPNKQPVDISDWTVSLTLELGDQQIVCHEGNGKFFVSDAAAGKMTLQILEVETKNYEYRTDGKFYISNTDPVLGKLYKGSGDVSVLDLFD